MEVLQTGSAITKLLSRLAFWSALILELSGKNDRRDRGELPPR
jgi:hypothetical protein